MVSRKINTDAIDENLLIASIGKSKIGTTTASILDGTSQNPVKDTEEKEEGEKKNPRSQMDKPAAPRKPSKVSSESYDAAFLKRNEIKTRQCVYISREIHKRISRIVSVLAKHELTVGGYIDLVSNTPLFITPLRRYLWIRLITLPSFIVRLRISMSLLWLTVSKKRSKSRSTT